MSVDKPGEAAPPAKARRQRGACLLRSALATREGLPGSGPAGAFRHPVPSRPPPTPAPRRATPFNPLPPPHRPACAGAELGADPPRRLCGSTLHRSAPEGVGPVGVRRGGSQGRLEGAGAAVAAVLHRLALLPCRLPVCVSASARTGAYDWLPQEARGWAVPPPVAAAWPAAPACSGAAGAGAHRAGAVGILHPAAEPATVGAPAGLHNCWSIRGAPLCCRPRRWPC